MMLISILKHLKNLLRKISFQPEFKPALLLPIQDVFSNSTTEACDNIYRNNQYILKYFQ